MIHWHRPTALDHLDRCQFPRWHAVKSTNPESVQTHCNGTWPVGTECEIATDPLEKCKVCADALATAPVLAGLRSLRSAPAISTLTTREHGVMSGAWDVSDEERDA